MPFLLRISSHFHIKAPQRLFTRKSADKIVSYYERLINDQVPNIHSDFSRLAPHVTGTSVGLVLGGGGARGAAHIGTEYMHGSKTWVRLT